MSLHNTLLLPETTLTQLPDKNNNIHHADIVVTHKCSLTCKHCVDRYVVHDKTTNPPVVQLKDVYLFLTLLKHHVESRDLTVLLLGGEPTSAPLTYLYALIGMLKGFGFKASISTNGVDRDKVRALLSNTDINWVQLTAHGCNTDREYDFYFPFYNRINMKFPITTGTTLDMINHVRDYEVWRWGRISFVVYFNNDTGEDLCTDPEVLAYLKTLKWERVGSYLYAFDDRGIRYKRGIPGETNIIDEPDIPKLYPSGVYNKTWCNEDSDPYLGDMASILKGYPELE